MLPELILDSDSFENLIEEYRSRIAGIYPDWTDYNYHDPGITFLELFTFLQENQQYFMQQLGPAHYRQFFRMAGIRPLTRRPARVLAEASGVGGLREFRLPCGTVFISGGMPFETIRDEWIPAAAITAVERQTPDGQVEFTAEVDESMEQDALSVKVFGQDPQPGTSMTIHIDGDLKTDTEMHLSLLLKEQGRNLMEAGRAFSVATLDWEYRTADGWAPVTVLNDETCGMLYSGRIRFRLENGPAADGEDTALRVVLKSGVYDAVPVLLGVSLREIELRQSRTMHWPDGKLVAVGNGFPEQEYPMPSKGFLAESVEVVTEDILQNGYYERWEKTDDFLNKGPDAKCYTLDEQTGTIRFGDGFHGMPPEGRILVKTLSESRGRGGNIKEHAAFMVEDRKLKVTGIPVFRMKHRIEAGIDPEKTEETLQRMTQEMGKVYRAVSCGDYEKLACTTPGLIIHSAHAWTDDHDPNTVYVAVRPGQSDQTLQLTNGIKEAVAANLEEHRLLGTRFVLQSPDYIKVDVSCEIIPSPNYRNAEAMVKAELDRFFKDREKEYGVALELSTLYGRVDKLPCVKKIIALQIDPVKAGIRRNPNGDLLPPPGGVFLPGKMDIYLNFYGD